LTVSFRWRLTLFGASVVAAALVVFGWLLYGLLASTQAVDQDKALHARVQDTFNSIDDSSASTLQGTNPQLTGAEDLRKHTDIFVEVLSSSGVVLASTGQIDGKAPAIPANLLQHSGFYGESKATFTPDGGPPLRVDVVPKFNSTRVGQVTLGPVTPADVEWYVVAGQPTSIVSTNLDGIRAFLVISAVPTLLAAFLATWLVTGRALRPLKLVATTAEGIGRTGDVHERLPPNKGGDEIGLLTGSFNAMLDRLAEANQQLATALETQRRFVADASHELRTPLTTIRGNAELLAYGPTIADDVRTAAARDIASESERMGRLVENLLTLARADAGQNLTLTPLNLRPIVEEVVRQAGAVHPEKQISAVGLSDATVNGDQDALTQLCWILLGNAIKFTREGGSIAVSLSQRDGRAELAVADDGPGIPEADLERVFERFFRTDASRSGKGAGLGLSIARWIVDQHGGTITASNNPSAGATFRVSLPAS
jgi:signal transduction histidine kinase